MVVVKISSAAKVRENSINNQGGCIAPKERNAFTSSSDVLVKIGRAIRYKLQYFSINVWLDFKFLIFPIQKFWSFIL